MSEQDTMTPSDGNQSPDTTSSQELATLRDLGVRLAREAGQLALSMRDSIVSSTETKSSSVDLVTAADKAAEAHIIEGILASRPDDGILGEEGGERASTSGVRWIIDPIDGTTNFVYNVPAFGVSIAAEQDGVVVAGIVYQPSTDTMYEAVLGHGAHKDGERLHINTPADLALSLIATGFGYLAERRQGQAEVLVEVLPRVRDIRRFGSAALDLCFLAEGQVDAYYERGLNDWDMAAGLLIAAEAGATIGDLRGSQPTTKFALAAPPALFHELRDLLLGAKADQRP